MTIARTFGLEEHRGRDVVYRSVSLQELNMELRVLALAVGIAASGVLAASAQTVIEERKAPPQPPSSVTVEQHGAGPATERKSTTVETNGEGGCTSKTVHKENPEGSKTLKKTNCE